MNRSQFKKLIIEWNSFIVKEIASSSDLYNYLKDSCEHIKNADRVVSIYDEYCNILNKPEYINLIKESVESHIVYFNHKFDKNYISKRKQGFDRKHSMMILEKIISSYTGNIALDDIGLKDEIEDDDDEFMGMILAHKIIKENENIEDFYEFLIKNMPPIILVCNENDLSEGFARLKDGNHRWGITEIVNPQINYIPAFIIIQKESD